MNCSEKSYKKRMQKLGVHTCDLEWKKERSDYLYWLDDCVKEGEMTVLDEVMRILGNGEVVIIFCDETFFRTLSFLIYLFYAK